MRSSAGPPAHLATARGFTPLGAIAERGAPDFDWALSDRDRIWADDVAVLAEQATAAQWDASRDVPWEAAQDLPEFMERAVSQVMTFIAQNEYAALYVPASFLPDINPGYPEVAMWLAGHVHDEARHIEVFTKRALLGGQPSYALASTELSLNTLLSERDFSGAALLLNILGEGTFLDLLRFVERYAPDRATRVAAALAHRDEVRHVHFGISHIRRRLEHDPEQRAALIAAAERRASRLTEMSGLSPLLTEGLTVMAAGSLQPAELAGGADAVRELMKTMEVNRLRRLQSAGFDPSTAQRLSDLHTPNLM
jgi:CRP-like cAMP-binding protein